MLPVFDFGGVVFRWRPARLVAKVWPHRARTGAELEATVQALFQSYQGDWGRFDQGLLDAAGLIEAVCARTGWAAEEMQALLAAVPEELVPQPETVALVQELRGAGHQPVFLSNMPRSFVAWLETNYPLEQWFAGGVFSSRERLCKPDPALFARAAERFGRPAHECLLIDDHPANVEAARHCGWQAELFTGASALRPRLLALGLLTQSG